MRRRERKLCLEHQLELPAVRLRRWSSVSGLSIGEALAAHGYLISESYALGLLSGQTPPGKHFIQAFYESTGIRLRRVT